MSGEWECVGKVREITIIEQAGQRKTRKFGINKAAWEQQDVRVQQEGGQELPTGSKVDAKPVGNRKLAGDMGTMGGSRMTGTCQNMRKTGGCKTGSDPCPPCVPSKHSAILGPLLLPSSVPQKLTTSGGGTARLISI